jgi:hypothetical protein
VESPRTLETRKFGMDSKRWKRRAKRGLEDQGLWDCVDPGFEGQLSRKDRRRDLRAKLLLLGAIEEWEEIADCESAKEVWCALDRVYECDRPRGAEEVQVDGADGDSGQKGSS